MLLYSGMRALMIQFSVKPGRTQARRDWMPQAGGLEWVREQARFLFGLEG